MSFTREDYIKVYRFCKKIYLDGKYSTEAREIAIKCEDVVGQLESLPAEGWEEP